MANNRDGIQIPVDAPGAEKAERELKDVAQAEQGLGRAAGKAGDEAEQAGRKVSRFRAAVGGVGGAIRSVASSWAVLATVSAAVLAFFREMSERAASERNAGAASAAITADQFASDLKTLGGGSRLVGAIRTMIDPFAAYRQEARSLYARGIRSTQLQPEAAAEAVGVPLDVYMENTDGDDRFIRAGGGTTVNINAQYNNANPPTSGRVNPGRQPQ